MATSPPARDGPPAGLVIYVAALLGAATALGWSLWAWPVEPPGDASWGALPVLTGLLVAAEYLFVRFRFGGETNALNLVEAVLAPLLFAFPVPVVMIAVATAQVVAGILRRNQPVKALFNVAQWSLVAGIAATVVGTIAPEGVLAGAIAVLLALGVAGLLNQLFFVVALALADRRPLGRVLSGLGPVMLPGWFAGWVVNSLVGLLFLFAYAAHPAAVVLFVVPLGVLHLAYRGYAGARTDRVRLAGLHRASQILAEPVDPEEGIASFLGEVAASFEAAAAALVLRVPTGRIVHHVDARTGEHGVRHQDPAEPSLEGALLAHPRAVRVTARGPGGLGETLIGAGWRDCLAAPIVEDGRLSGALAVFDQIGFEGFEDGELAVIEALARETGAVLMKGRLVTHILEERRKLAGIVGATSDGICTISEDGILRSWNPAMERITGRRAEEVVDRPDGIQLLDVKDEDGEPVALERWSAGARLMPHLTIENPDGDRREIQCSYSESVDDLGERSLVVVARDVTPEREMEELQQRVGRLAEAQEAQRVVVEQMQQALMPRRPRLGGFELAVSYVASGEGAPTGGDLYDWHLLPSGELHLAVVDALGHGVAATKDALGVVHALRLLAVQGCPLDELVASADQLIADQRSDLAATVVVGRLDPATGELRIASGGHPPALLVGADGGVRQLLAAGGAIGWPGAGSERIAEHRMDAGEALVLYTDGIVEVRKDIIEGTERLMRFTRELADAPAEDLAHGVMDRALEGASNRDDSLVLVLRRVPAMQRERWSIPPQAGPASQARRSLAAWLSARQVPDAVVDDLQLVAAELLSNAVVGARSSVELRAALEPDRVTVEVEDDGRGSPLLESRGVRLPRSEAERGRGLFIVRALMDEVDAIATPDGALVRCRRRLSFDASEERVRGSLRVGPG